MGIYEDIAGSAAPRGSGAFITPGDYLVTLLANRQFKSNKPGNPETFVVEAKVSKPTARARPATARASS